MFIIIHSFNWLGPGTGLHAGETEITMAVSLVPRGSQPGAVIQFCVASVLRETSWYHDDLSIESSLVGTSEASRRRKSVD